jgi:hypothetical protein
VFRLQAREPIAVAIPRVLREEFGAALSWLGGADRPLELRVHEARKCLKRVRAVLALANDALAPELRRRIRDSARTASHALETSRGESALRECVDGLLERYPNELTAEEAARLRSATSTEASVHEAEADAEVHQALAILQRDYGVVSTLKLEEDGWYAIEGGFRSTYRRARNAFASAEPGGPLELWHCVRIPAKRHAYQLELLEPLWEGPIKALRLEFEELGELLGEHHDLSLLERELTRRPELSSLAEAAGKVAARRLRKLEREATRLGARAFVDRPGRLSRRFAAYFRAWST